MSTQIAQVVMLPTNDKTLLKKFYVGHNYQLLFKQNHIIAPYQHLYFTTDEPIQKGDWYTWKDGTIRMSTRDNNPRPDCNGYKVIASTDPALGLREIPSTWIKDVFIPSNGSIKEVKLHTNIMAGGTPIINVNDNFEVIIEHTTSDKDIEEAATKS